MEFGCNELVYNYAILHLNTKYKGIIGIAIWELRIGNLICNGRGNP